MGKVSMCDIIFCEDCQNPCAAWLGIPEEPEAHEDMGFDCDIQHDVTDEDRAILEAALVAGDWDFYSDYYKDCYGVRPRR